MDKQRQGGKPDEEDHPGRVQEQEPTPQISPSSSSIKNYGAVTKVHPVGTTPDSDGSVTIADETDSFIDDGIPTPSHCLQIPPVRRLSTYESSEGGMNLEDDLIGGSARSL